MVSKSNVKKKIRTMHANKEILRLDKYQEFMILRYSLVVDIPVTLQ